MPDSKLTGLIVATVTPFNDDGSINLSAIGPYVEFLIRSEVDGFFVCGTTGEGMSLSSQERKDTASEFIQCAAGRVPVVVHVGHNSLTEAQSLASHAQREGATATSATCPSYFKPADNDVLIDSMAFVAAGAPDLPFYYYNIPSMSGVRLSMIEFLSNATDKIENLVGLKFTDPTLHEFQACCEFDDHRFDILWGVDEMLLASLAVGAVGAVGSTYNIAAPLYKRLIESFGSGSLDDARALQSKSISMIRTLAAGPFLPGMKRLLKSLGQNCGACRLPLPTVSDLYAEQLDSKLRSIGYFDWNGLSNSDR